MSTIDRRVLLGTIAVAGAATAASAQQTLEMSELRKEAEIACLYHCDFGDTQRFSQMITNINNHYSAYDTNPFALELAIVAHGQGVKFFLQDLAGTSWKDDDAALKLFPQIEGQAKNGLQVYLCDITFQRLKLDRSKVHKADWIRFVPSGVASVAALQAKGYAYLKVG